MTSLKLLKEFKKQHAIYLESHTQRKISLRSEDFSRQTKPKRIYKQQTKITKNVKESSSGRKNMTPDKPGYTQRNINFQKQVT